MTKIAPNQHVRNLAHSYLEAYQGEILHLPGFIIEGHYVKSDPIEQSAIAKSYAELPYLAYDATTFYCYTMLKNEIWLQFNWLVEHGYTLDPWNYDGQPYQNSEEMCTDVRYHKHLWYFTGGEDHPFLQEHNLLLRAIHDVFGHAAEGFQFGPRGEVNAWIHHSMMFSFPAARALTTETHGQNSFTNYGPYSHIPRSKRPFADQKVALLPVEYCNWQKWLN